MTREFYQKERLAVFDLLLKERENLVSGKFWTIAPSTVRFHQGESMPELKIPYHIGADDESIMEKAVYGLAILLKRRFEESIREGLTPVPHALTVAISRPLKEKIFKTDLLLPDSIEKDIASFALHTTPLVDGAILTNWLGPDGHGKNLIYWLPSVIEKAMKDEASSATGERTSYLALLSIINSIRNKKEELKKLRIRGISYEKLDIAAGFTLYAACEGSLRMLFERLREKNVPYYNPETERILKSALTPGAFLSIPSNLLSTSMNPYGISRELFDMMAALIPSIEDVDAGADKFLDTIASSLKGKKDISESIKLQSDILEARRLIVDYLMDFDVPGLGAHKLLYDIYSEDRLLKSLFSDARLIEKVKGALGDIKENFSKDAKRVEAIGKIGDFLSSFEKKAGWFKKSEEKAGISPEGVSGNFLVCWLDGYVERFTSAMRSCLVDRRREYDDKRLISEYRAGRLYRFSVDARPILSPFEKKEEGQLFIDMKDFSRRTLKVKEIAMAEFMKDNFYNPILEAASRYAEGTGLLLAEGGIRLVSLPGDAAAFSGGVSNLICLARDIQRIISRYRETLLKRFAPLKDELLVEDINKRFKVKKDELGKKREELKKSLERGETGAMDALLKLGEEDDRCDHIYREELESAITREIEAGLFISYGAKAEELVLEERKDFCGPVKVAIGEKINEAARGTYRNSRIRAKLEMLLEKERVKRNNPRTRYPFDVYIDRTFIVRIPPEINASVEGLITKGKTGDAKDMAAWIARECYDDFQRLVKGALFSSLRVVESHTDIYNKGQALSEEALKAYIKETKGVKFFFQKEAAPGELHKDIQENFFFPSQKLKLTFACEVKNGVESIEAFLRSGEVIFKGFEAARPTVVYEIIDGEGEFFKALETHHLAGWLEEAKKKK